MQSDDRAQREGPPRVRVGIVSWNTAHLLDRCLTALPAALDGLEADVVVVDNDSSDGSADVAGRHPGVTVIRNQANLGYARGMNQALTHGGETPPFLVALNPDTEPPPSSLADLVTALSRDPGVGVAVPRLVGADGLEQHSAYRFPSLALATVVAFVPVVLQRRWVGRHFWLEGYSDHQRETDVDWAIGAVHVIRSSALSERAPYDERWFMYAEDLELCWRVRQEGWRVRLVGTIPVPHVGNAAGAQAWGADRTIRWLVPTYQWYASARGAAAARRWAIVSWAGLVWLRCKWRVLARLDRRRHGHLAWWAADAVAPLALHGRVATRGVSALDDLPSGPPTGTV